GKDNGENILKSIYEEPFKMGKITETLAEGAKGALRPERDRVFADLSPEEKDRNEENVFQTDQCDAFNSDVDEALTLQTMFIANLLYVDPIYDEAGPSYDSDILSDVQDHDNYVDSIDEYHDVHEMQNDVQPNYIVESDVEYTSVSNMIPYEQIIITGRNIKEESLKKELHSVKMQLNSTIGYNKSMREEVATLKKDFKQKENKYLEDFLDMKALKEKVEDELFKQDQSLQTVHMLCKPKPYYDERNKVAIGYKNAFYLTKAMRVQSALYNGHEIVKTHHASSIVHDSEDILEIAETTRKKKNEKMKDLMYVKKKVKIIPPEYSKENYLKTFTPQKQLTLEQIFWSDDVLKEKAKALKERANDLKQITTITVYPPNTLAKRISRVLPTTTELSKLKDKIQKDDHSEMIKCFSNLEIDHLNLKLKYQNLKECFGNNKSQPSRDTLEFDMFFELNKMKASLQGKDNTINKLKVKISQLMKTRSKADRTLDFKALDFQITQLTDKVTVLQEQNDLFRAEKEKIKQHYKELYDSIKITSTKTIEKTTALLAKNENLKAQIKCKMKCITMNSVKPKVLSPGFDPLALVELVTPIERITGCSKHMTRNRSRLMNFVKKFIGTVRFKNDHFNAIIGSRASNLYTISVEYMMKSSPICLLSKASKNKSWLWHHQLNHLNFETINDLARKDLVRGLPRLKFEKDHLCSACQLGKSKKYTHKPKSENTIMEVLHTIHMDLCRPIRVQSINGKKYILVIVDDYSRFTWVKFLRSKMKL
nr:retrovirus-related Pol polyprotein from transposon TNT 1-94 [Tanacetum cinerariifolium]